MTEKPARRDIEISSDGRRFGAAAGNERSRINLTTTDLGVDRHHPRSGSIRWKSAGQADDVFASGSSQPVARVGRDLERCGDAKAQARRTDR